MAIVLGVWGAAFAALAQPASSSSRWEKDIAAFEAADRTNPPPAGAVLFVGSSSIRLWKTLAEDFPGHPVINRGFGGSEIRDSDHFADRIVLPYKPRLIVMYAGGNDINAGKKPDEVLADFRRFAGQVHAAQPEIRLAYIAIAPNPARWAQVDRVREANRLIQAYTRTDHRFHFIDVYSAMLGEDGLPRPDIFVEDRLHMNSRGYAIWKRLVAPVLEEK